MEEPSAHIAREYLTLLEQFLLREMSPEAFVASFQGKFLQDKRWKGDMLFSCLDTAFGAAEVYSNDSELLSRRPDMYIDEHQLRRELTEVRDKLSKLANG